MSLLCVPVPECGRVQIRCGDAMLAPDLSPPRLCTFSYNESIRLAATCPPAENIKMKVGNNIFSLTLINMRKLGSV